ncbi:MAG TPA: hypothetical protein VEY67_12320, partial [Candidatus Dormibacteraeota bacterium]|nr:hypothetical protein [Candidatus Dormibacteraeota bacterium]
MGRIPKLLAAGAVGLAIPPLAALVARSRFEGTGEDADDLRLGVFFGSAEARSHARALRDAEAVAWYGALDLDLREARLDARGARLRVVALFAGARIVIPSGWDVVIRRVAVFGTVDAQLAGPSGEGPRLMVDVVAAFAGV